MARVYPAAQPGEIQYLTTEAFLGYQNRPRPEVGAFAKMRNLTSDGYPLLSVRRGRQVYARPEQPSALCAKDTLCYTDGKSLVIGGYRIDLGLNDEKPKQLVSMGAYLIIFPDKKYVNTADYSDFGNLEAVYSAASVEMSPCTGEGKNCLPDYCQASPPETPENMALWLDTSGESPALMQWSASGGMWVEVTRNFFRMDAPGIGRNFRAGDGVGLSGFGEWDGWREILLAEEDALVFAGFLPEERTLTGALQIFRQVPRLDYVIECDNRLWGCRYGLDENGSYVNEIYASKLGDFKNWRCYSGTAADSYALSLGSDGCFTGAVNFLGYPLFFKETCLHKILGSVPGEFRLQTTPCRGVQQGADRSLAMVGEVLYYKSPQGVCAFDGSLPVEVAEDLGKISCTFASGGAWRGKYYLSMKTGDTGMLAVYDSQRGMWHLEDELAADDFALCRDKLYALREKEILCLTPEEDTGEIPEWMAQTGILDGGTPDAKFLSGLAIRMALPEGSSAGFFLRYDSGGAWLPAGTLTGGGMGIFTVPIHPRRCDHLELRIQGKGRAEIYSLTRAMEKGEAIL